MPELCGPNILILVAIITLYLQLQGEHNANLREIRELIQATNSDRQADTRRRKLRRC